MTIGRKLTIAFDINGTLSVPQVTKLFKALDRSRCHLIVWSSLGPPYCRRFCAENGLEPDEIIEKNAKEVDLAFDDYPQNIKTARILLGVIDTHTKI